MSEMAAGGSETLSDLESRVSMIAQALAEHGHSQEEISMAMKIEYMKAEVLQDWQAETAETLSTEP